jgi:hypothetical protein
MQLSTLQQQHNRYQILCDLHQKKRMEAEIAETRRLIESAQLQLVNTKLSHFQLLNSKSSDLQMSAQIERLHIQSVIKAHESEVLKLRSRLLNGQDELKSLKSGLNKPESSPVFESVEDDPQKLNNDMQLRLAIVRVSDIQAPEPALAFDETQLKQAAQLILNLKGTVNPLILRRVGHDGATCYRVIDGHFEYYAAVIAKAMDSKRGHTINAYIIENDEQEQAFCAQLEVFRPQEKAPVTKPLILAETSKENELEKDVSQEPVIPQNTVEPLKTEKDLIEEPVTAEITEKVSQQIEQLKQAMQNTQDAELKEQYQSMLDNLQQTFDNRLATFGLLEAADDQIKTNKAPDSEVECCASCGQYTHIGFKSNGDGYGQCRLLNKEIFSDGLCASYAVNHEVVSPDNPLADDDEVESCASCAQYTHIGCESNGDSYGQCSVFSQETYSIGLCASYVANSDEFEAEKDLKEGELLPKAPAKDPDPKPEKATSREPMEIDPDHDVFEKLQKHLKADWDEKQKSEVALQNAIRHDFSSHWPQDSELLSCTVLEVKATEKVCRAATLVEQQGEKPFIVYCLAYQIDEDGFIAETQKDRRTYKRASSAHNKVYKWVNESKQ